VGSILVNKMKVAGS